MALRALALARRDALDPSARIEAAFAIAERALSLVPANAAIVAGYLPMRSEVDPRPLMMGLKDRRLRLCVPVVLAGRRLEFRELLPDMPLVAQGFGTFGPPDGAPVLVPEIVLVPLAAFDRRCQRIGYGGGFYDRALADLRAAERLRLAIGLAYAGQEIPAVPAEAFDVALDLIVTEAATIRPALAEARPAP